MIDTIKLNLRDCQIRSNANIKVVPGVIDLQSGKTESVSDLFYDDRGRIVTGHKAYLNTDKFNLTIMPGTEVEFNDRGKPELRKKRFSRIVNDFDFWDSNYFEEENTGTFVQTSLPRYQSTNNFKQLELFAEKEMLEQLEKDLKFYGIKTNIWNSEISRIDSFVNIKTEHNFFNYTPLFDLMDCSRKKSVEWNGETYLWKNKEAQIMAYDKIIEMKNKNPKVKLPAGNYLRIENRYLKRRKIKSKLGFTSLSELYGNYDVLKQCYKKEIETNLFKYELPEIDLLTDNQMEQELINAKHTFGRNWLQRYLMIRGISSLNLQGNLDNFIQVIEKIDSKKNIRVKKHRIRGMITEMKMFLGTVKTGFKSNRELYNELRTKFYKQVA